MTENLRTAIKFELEKGKALFTTMDYTGSFRCFGRMHVLGQKSIFYHTISHFWMLKVAIAQNNFKEIIGQIFRIPSGFIGSLVGIVPEGNTGGANVGPFKSMPIPKDLQIILKS